MYELARPAIYSYSIQRGTPHVNLRQKRASLFNSQILVVALIGIFGGLKPKMCVHFSKDWRSALFSMKIRSDRVIRTALRSIRCPLQHIRIPAESGDSFMKRWTVQLSDYRRSGTGQKSILQYQS